MIEALTILLSGIQIGIVTAFISGFIFVFKLVAWIAGVFISFCFVVSGYCVIYGFFIFVKTIVNLTGSKLKKLGK